MTAAAQRRAPLELVSDTAVDGETDWLFAPKSPSAPLAAVDTENVTC
jgi:hypothetical protein